MLSHLNFVYLLQSEVTAPPVEFCPIAIEDPILPLPTPTTVPTVASTVITTNNTTPMTQPSSAPMSAPVVGEKICACQPQAFTLVLDLGGHCDINDIEGEQGIDETVCVILDEKKFSISGRSPAFISVVRISEFDKTLKDVIAQTSFKGNFTSGDTFDYQGFVANATVVPSLLLVELLGVDTDGKELLNTWVIGFTNECDVYPVLSVGQQLAWTIIVRSCFGTRRVCWHSPKIYRNLSNHRP
jgi:hypothetical protein